MSTYLIGDVQGCYYSLLRLLDHIHFDPSKDQLGFVGDLINRGPHSLETLRFIKSLNNPLIVLGNHDIYLLMLGYDCVNYDGPHTLDTILNADDKHELLDWLRHQPLMHYDDTKQFVMVHAGIPAQWSIHNALLHAKEVTHAFTQPDYTNTLKQLYGNTPDTWSEQLSGVARLRYIINALTRMRFCDKTGTLNLEEKSIQVPDGFSPWFDLTQIEPSIDIYFGHWATLRGKTNKQHIHALDTGCVYGHELTAIRIEDKKRFSVPYDALDALKD